MPTNRTDNRTMYSNRRNRAIFLSRSRCMLCDDTRLAILCLRLESRRTNDSAATFCKHNAPYAAPQKTNTKAARQQTVIISKHFNVLQNNIALNILFCAFRQTNRYRTFYATFLNWFRRRLTIRSSRTSLSSSRK